MLPSIALTAAVVFVGTVAASYVMTRASNQSAVWNIWAGASAVLAAAVILVLAAAVVVRWVFPEFY